MTKRIKIPVGGGLFLVAEQNCDPNYDREIFIGLTNESDVWYQDLAIVRQEYKLDENATKWLEDKFEVLVYADKDSEDYTDKFQISRYESDAI